MSHFRVLGTISNRLPKVKCARHRDKPQRTPKGGGQNSGGGGAKPHEENPHGKQFPTPPHLGTSPPPPPNATSLIKSLTNSQNFPRVTPSKTVFGGSPKMVSDRPSLRGFAPPPLFCPPPLFRIIFPPPTPKSADFTF